ncbi:hypothetical protein MSHOH_0965 [Methanosarcina horonobensis HB-1 = JCM 15518]|uniref:Peptidase S54 rhomboid domain-containing protein n=1 Tax=Methanosarcina horonobensis HB-1 = JCM 15518 TaxID=1434110 RepID=A0A0E3SDD9_9EURY|nr:hypothetical protein [Methanosarcina horonobensis]AKB77448.1 hypothetical protein MSHOH_0965 [Methanosarcina horonobensis HB-1 = JCM 15518]
MASIDLNLKNRESFIGGVFPREVILYILLPVVLTFSIYTFLRVLWDLDSSLASNVILFFILDPANLNTNVFLSSYTHTIFWAHLVPNVIAYIILLTLISWLIAKRTKLKLLMIMCLIVYPIVNSVFCICFSKTNVGNGLSGIVYCLLGYLPLATYLYAKNELRMPLKLYIFFIAILSNLTVYVFYKEVIISLFFLVILIFLLYFERKNLFESLDKIIQTISQQKSTIHKIFNLALAATLIAVPPFIWITFVPIIQIEGLNVDHKVHMFGLLYGLTISSFILYKDLKMPLKTDVLS